MDGIIVINKPKGCTSHDIVYKVKKLFNQKVGHTGTLDPNATGVLPLLIGKGTQISKYLINHNKTYEVELQLGIKTETADIEGKIIEEKEVDKKFLIKENIEKVLKSFLGKQQQIPPIYSAIKVKGKKLYEYARKGEKVEILPRNIEIFDIELIHINKEKKQVKFLVSCSKGTYIRTLCEDIATKLNTVGFMLNLNRIKVGDFSIYNSVTLDELTKNFESKEWLDGKIITIEDFFKTCYDIHLFDRKFDLFLNGVNITQNRQDGVYRIYNKDVFIGTGTISNNLLKRDIIL